MGSIKLKAESIFTQRITISYSRKIPVSKTSYRVLHTMTNHQKEVQIIFSTHDGNEDRHTGNFVGQSAFLSEGCPLKIYRHLENNLRQSNNDASSRRNISFGVSSKMKISRQKYMCTYMITLISTR
jgi:hypothetical protein